MPAWAPCTAPSTSWCSCSSKARRPTSTTSSSDATAATRSNVWDYPGQNTFHRNRNKDLAAHPTVKPVALVADAIRDVTERGSIVLDPFNGSGTTILAAEKTGRRARTIELDPAYVDVAIRRWEAVTGASARHAVTGRTFTETQASRANPEIDHAA